MKAYMKFISTVLALTMIASSLAGCGNEPADSEKDSALNIANNIEIVAGNKTSIEINKENDEEAVFSSDNEAVARIDENGEITAVSNGEAVITVKIGDKEEFYAVKVTEKSPEDIEKELEETKKQLEEALKENAELKGETSESSSEAPAEDENSKESSDKAENAESKPVESKPVEEKKPAESKPAPTEEKKPESKPAETKPQKPAEKPVEQKPAEKPIEVQKPKNTKTESREKTIEQMNNLIKSGMDYEIILGTNINMSVDILIEDGVLEEGFNLKEARNIYQNEWGGKPDSPEYETTPEQEVEGKNEEDLAYEVVDLVNKEREKAGLNTLPIDDYLMEVSAMRAKEVAESYAKGIKGHKRPNGEDDVDMAQPTYRCVLPNIAYRNATPTSAVNAWMNSAGHKKNILYSEHDIIGAGCYNSNGTLFWIVTLATSDGNYPNY